MTVYSTASKVLNDGRTYYFVTLDGQIPCSATRYKTAKGARRAAINRAVKFGRAGVQESAFADMMREHTRRELAELDRKISDAKKAPHIFKGRGLGL